ncbi:conjugal transfer protein TrbL family protein [Desulfitobacterium hafniense]|uniref:conjugal transfer protein TrbL family protein n=1 Tax=Desulfitobacterium hafniense TaxID=49338 RepID=UPI00036CD4A9|nr:conjugal transfer protein TrbL family protein [Desulfitobacterium hafniense]
MVELLMILIEALLKDAVSYMDMLLLNLVPIAFYTENAFDAILGINVMTELRNILFYFGVSLIALKFVQKGFNTYVLWTDGDADADPLLFLTYLLKALVVAISFPTLYYWMATIVEDLTGQILAILTQGVSVNFALIVTQIMSAGILTAILGVIYFAILLKFYLGFLKTGLEILILRLGIPIACVGLIDSDQGVFKTYMQKFFQVMITVMLQIILLKLSFALVVNGNLIWAIVAVMTAMSTPRLLQEFMIPGGQGGNALGKAYYATQMIRALRR